MFMWGGGGGGDHLHLKRFQGKVLSFVTLCVTDSEKQKRSFTKPCLRCFQQYIFSIAMIFQFVSRGVTCIYLYRYIYSAPGQKNKFF